MTADAEAAPRLAAESPLQSGCDLTSLASTPVDEARFLEARGFFDKLYYLDDNPDVAASDVDPFEHFFLYGYKEGRKPNIAFDTRWYLETYSDVREAGVNCLLHYALLGEREGRRPGALFDVEWYRERHRIDESDSAVLHYLRVRRTGVSPIPHFDAAYYLTTYPDIATAGVDPFEHFMSYGFSEGRNPSPDFDANFYVRRYLGGDYSRNPLLHYLSLADRSGVTTKPRDSDQTIPNLVKRYSKPGDDYEELRPLPRAAARKAKVLAYYLPQFHPIAENDRWWGEGFTEWTNIARGLPRFENHFQPRIPRDLGFYNLLDLDVVRRQVGMAKASGIHGFVYYYYNFNNHRLLEKPLEAFLAAPDIDMPFALMWANENWTRRWDGMESEVLIKQDYRAGDDRALCADFLRHFRDPRYIRASGRPLLMIYRPAVILKAKERLAAWRRIFAENGEEPILIMSQAFNDTDPTVYGLDGAIEFPPHKLTSDIERMNGRLKFFDDAFSGNVFAYDDVVERSLNEPAASFPLIKTATPNWDNDARRQGGGLCLHCSTPQKYERWLSELVDRAMKRPFFGEPFVGINAWNEWCEGAYLEPDVHYGAAYLNATGRAVTGAVARSFRLLLVGHDAFPSGAQQLLLNIGKTLKSALGLDIHFVLLDGGELEESYRAVAPVTVLKTLSNPKALLAGLVTGGFTAAVVNTCAAAPLALTLRALGARSVLLVHELPRLLREKALEDAAREGLMHADTVVFPSRFVKDRLLEALGSPPVRDAIILPQGLYKMLQPNARAAARVRKELGIAADEPLVLGVGYADIRKGFDLFLQIWRLCQQNEAKVHFCWIGAMDPELKRWFAAELEGAAQTGTFHLPGYTADVEGYYAAANAFALTSREDPFPSVALEALSLGVPVVAFEGSGGIPDLLEDEDLGVVVKYGDALLFARSLMRLVRREHDAAAVRRMRRFIEDRFCFADYVRDLVVRAMPELPSVTVAVPNYNYAAYLRERLNSVFDQTHPIEEVIVLDDASTDESVEVIEEMAQERSRDLTLIINETNSGSVFKQWSRAVEAARGEFIWLAEADDRADPQFLAQILALMKQDPAIRFGFCDSQSVDGEGKPVYDSYKPYFATLEPDALRRNEIFDGLGFVSRFLSVKNVILNVSSVVWRREALARALEVCEGDLQRFRMAGDWRLYLEALAAPGARVAYVAAPLNIHRRHAASVTHSLNAQSHIDEVADIHRWLQDRGATPSSAAVAQRAYRAELQQQFGLVAATGLRDPATDLSAGERTRTFQ